MRTVLVIGLLAALGLWACVYAQDVSVPNNVPEGMDTLELDPDYDVSWRKKQIERGIIIPGPPMPTIATCDPQKVIDSYEKAKAGLDVLTKKIEAARQELQTKATQVQTKQQELDALKKKRGKDYEKLVTEVATLSAELRVFLDARNKELTAERNTLIAASLAEINTAIAKVAKDKGVNLVLSARADVRAGDAVLYASNDLDITEAVITELNKKEGGE